MIIDLTLTDSQQQKTKLFNYLFYDSEITWLFLLNTYLPIKRLYLLKIIEQALILNVQYQNTYRIA